VGKYDYLFATEETSECNLNPEEALAAIVTVAAHVDGEPSSHENQITNDMINNLDRFANYSDHKRQKMFNKITGILNKEGLGVLFNTAVESLTDDLAETAFELASEVILSDGKVDPAEDTLLFELCSALGIPETIAQEVIDEAVLVS
jgi:tellurite resistance protein